jgi:site-specific DNA-methyltransferase (adenine-specific)
VTRRFTGCATVSYMQPYWSDQGITLYLGDCLDVLAALEPASVDAVVTDPPYGLEFMGREWDGDSGFRSSLGTEHTTGAGRRGKPGIGERTTDWVSNQGWNGFRCRTCGHLSHGGSPCQCEQPDFARADSRWNLYQEWCTAWAADCLRVLKPGGHLLAFGGTRTYHRLGCAIEDAGFEIRDSIHWIYGSGFPKSLNVSKAIDGHVLHGKTNTRTLREVNAERPGDGRTRPSTTNNGIVGESRGTKITRDEPATPEGAEWDGWGTALKPAHEPIVVARKPLDGTVAQNVLTHGTGALNVDGCRVPGAEDGSRNRPPSRPGSTTTYAQDEWTRTTIVERRDTTGLGRWPPNVILGPEAAAEMDQQSASTHSAGAARAARREAGPAGMWDLAGGDGHRFGDSGGVSRFFPVFRYQAKAPARERPRLDDGTSWPTVKPVDLMAWLVRLVTPRGGTVLDPFGGSGATAEACLAEGAQCVLIDKDPVAVQLIRKRLSKPIQPTMFGI